MSLRNEARAKVRTVLRVSRALSSMGDIIAEGGSV
jgi:hypothetical protein